MTTPAELADGDDHALDPPFWTIAQAIVWIATRDATRAGTLPTCRRLRTASPDGLERALGNDCGGRKNSADARVKLVHALQSGAITAVGFDERRQQVQEIPALAWTSLRLEWDALKRELEPIQPGELMLPALGFPWRDTKVLAAHVRAEFPVSGGRRLKGEPDAWAGGARSTTVSQPELVATGRKARAGRSSHYPWQELDVLAGAWLMGQPEPPANAKPLAAFIQDTARQMGYGKMHIDTASEAARACLRAWLKWRSLLTASAANAEKTE